MRALWEAAQFLRGVRKELRFGELSRSPLRLLRFELQGEHAECDWMARQADAWDADVPQPVSGANVAKQALLDAIAVREFLFYSVPGVESATLRAFRASCSGELEMIIVGSVVRGPEAYRRISSLPMRAKLLGFRFGIGDGVLEALRSEEYALSL